MGLTLIAVLTAALLLPGIVAARAFYAAAQTREVEPAVPSLSSIDGIALVGLFSIGVHLVYILALHLVMALPPIVPLPPADPYRLFTVEGAMSPGLNGAFALFSGLAWLCVVATIVGNATGRIVMRYGDRGVFYGPLSAIIEAGDGEGRFIVAYVLTKVRHDRRIIGYQGTVATLSRDSDRLPSKVVLKDANLFYLDVDDAVPARTQHGALIDWITLVADDWENIAFRVFELRGDLPEDEEESPVR